MSEAGLEDVLKGTIDGPGGTFDIVSGSVIWSIGTQPGTATFLVYVPGGLSGGLKEFDGTHVGAPPGGFSRTLLPSSGDGMATTGWSVTIEDPQGETVNIKNLILTEVSVDKVSGADGSDGTFNPDPSGRDQIVRFTFSDARLLWQMTGDICGQRNLRSNINDDDVQASAPEANVSISSVKITSSGAGGVSVGGASGEFKLPKVEDSFASMSLKEGELYNAKELIEEVTNRIPFTAGGGSINPASIDSLPSSQVSVHS